MHNEIYKSYCNEYKINLCFQREIEHNNQEIINYIIIILDKSKKKKKKKNLERK